MVLFNYSTKELTAKIVYYGPGLCGKTTNLQFIYDNLPDTINKGKMLSLATKTDRTLFFDFLPIDLGTIRGMRTRLQLYTVPGQVFYNTTRKLVLKGADGVVFVADSQKRMLDADVESLKNLEDNLAEHDMNLVEMPLILQFNKRDLPDVMAVEDLNAALNRFNAPIYEAVATTGIGVHETLKAITRLVLNSLKEKYADKRDHRAEPPAQVAASAAARAAARRTAPAPAPAAAPTLAPPAPPAARHPRPPAFSEAASVVAQQAPQVASHPVFETPGSQTGTVSLGEDTAEDLLPVETEEERFSFGEQEADPAHPPRAIGLETLALEEEEPFLEVVADDETPLELAAGEDVEVLELSPETEEGPATPIFGENEPEALTDAEPLFEPVEEPEAAGPTLDVTEEIFPPGGASSFTQPADTAPGRVVAATDVGSGTTEEQEFILDTETGAPVAPPVALAGDRHEGALDRAGIGAAGPSRAGLFEEDRSNLELDIDESATPIVPRREDAEPAAAVVNISASPGPLQEISLPISLAIGEQQIRFHLRISLNLQADPHAGKGGRGDEGAPR